VSKIHEFDHAYRQCVTQQNTYKFHQNNPWARLGKHSVSRCGTFQFGDREKMAVITHSSERRQAAGLPVQVRDETTRGAQELRDQQSGTRKNNKNVG
jgi:hypothetical protein